jgi:hypothetical protein
MEVIINTISSQAIKQKIARNFSNLKMITTFVPEVGHANVEHEHPLQLFHVRAKH